MCLLYVVAPSSSCVVFIPSSTAHPVFCFCPIVTCLLLILSTAHDHYVYYSDVSNLIDFTPVSYVDAVSASSIASDI